MKTLAAPHAVADGAVTETVFRRVMASFVTGVTVITTQVRGEIRGMTANAFMSGSLEPPLCVVSVGKKARMHAFLLESGHFGMNILVTDQGFLPTGACGMSDASLPTCRTTGESPSLWRSSNNRARERTANELDYH
jgi:hypothetical protein